MILIDTSAWIEFLRDTGSRTAGTVEQLLSDDLATCGVVRMELLAGARDEAHLLQLRRLLAMATDLRIMAEDYETAAALYRRCRINGETVRRLTDCLIAAIAIRNDTPLLHRDQDFSALARATALREHLT